MDGEYYIVSFGGYRTSSNGKTPIQLAWFLNRNNMVILPDGKFECDAKEFYDLNEIKKDLIQKYM